jgi:hypothetical protein
MKLGLHQSKAAQHRVAADSLHSRLISGRQTERNEEENIDQLE